ncbi:hypothetical protein BDW42DRAFT_169546 [Aspergillus taichungensis]|uniref:Apple domain-containing protein n=1 Tax=Aspergillus taichungensis TaxID=482145 RepID=A0A2J5HUM4_9EURO|nr:hypothetical protein BDW42DRAFT_169546 [Aspergillus taichungensis]
MRFLFVSVVSLLALGTLSNALNIRDGSDQGVENSGSTQTGDDGGGAANGDSSRDMTNDNGIEDNVQGNHNGDPQNGSNGHSHNDDDDSGIKRICPHLATQDKGCVRYTRGFDVTGVVSEVDLTFPEVASKCDCIQACLDRPGTCANYVWKFSTADAVESGHRTCTLYSDFNLPGNVSIQFDLGSANNKNINAAGITSKEANPDDGGPVPQAFKDLDSLVPDHDAVSGPVWVLANGKVQC